MRNCSPRTASPPKEEVKGPNPRGERGMRAGTGKVCVWSEARVKGWFGKCFTSASTNEKMGLMEPELGEFQGSS